MNDHFNHCLYSHVTNKQMANKKVISDQFPTPKMAMIHQEANDEIHGDTPLINPIPCGQEIPMFGMELRYYESMWHTLRPRVFKDPIILFIFNIA